jgi:outer membrane receptor protein involved in Fe transport
MRFTHLLRGTASFVVLAMATAAHAQTSPTTGQSTTQVEEEEPDSVEGIVVTAQRREQRLQDVPVVVTALSEQILEDSGVRDIRDLQTLTPGLTVTSTQSEVSTTARIRGVGTVGDNPGLESSVGVMIDGVYRPRNGVAFGDLGELERIEVLKGPQGTLFGRNTSAGVINVITKEPEFTFGVDAELTAGNYGERGVAAAVTGPVFGETWAARLFGARRMRDGYLSVRTGEGPRTDTEDTNRDFWTVRGQLLGRLGANADVRFIADYTQRDELCCAAVQIRTGPTFQLIDAFASDEGQANPARPFDRVAYSNRTTAQRIEDGGLSAEVNVELPFMGGVELTSISAVRGWDSENGQDPDFSTADLIHRPDDGTFAQQFSTLSQELRLQGTAGPLDWLIGTFFVSEDVTRNDNFIFGNDYELYFSNIVLNNAFGVANRNRARLGAPLIPQTALANGSFFINEVVRNSTANPGRLPGTNYPVGEGYRDTYAQETHSLALFTHNIFRVTDRFDVTVGLRYTTEDKEVTSSFRNTGGAGFACGAAAANPAGTVGALVARGFSVAEASAVAPIVVGAMCLPWQNPGFNNRQTYQERTENEWSGTGKLTFRPTDDLMTYLSYARGYKSGGFNLDRTQSSNGLQTGTPSGIVPVADTSFPAEFVDSWELGAKTSLLGKSLLLNATLFHQTFEQFQLNTFLGTTFIVESIPEVTSQGVDADVVWFAPIEGLTFQGGVTYAKTEYGNFTARTRELTLLPGATLSFAPEWSASGSLTYEREFGGMLARFNVGAKYNSEYNTGSDLLPFKVQEAFTLFNGRIAIGPSDERWSLEFWGQNITDEDYIQVAFNAFLQGSAFPPDVTSYQPTLDTQTYNAFLGQPRTFGITLRVEY